MSFGSRITGRSRLIDCQLLLLFLIGIIATSSGAVTTTSWPTNTQPRHTETDSATSGQLHNDTITTFAIANTTLLHISTTASSPPTATSVPSTVLAPVATSGAALAVTHSRIEVQHPPSIINELTTDSTSLTSRGASSSSVQESTGSSDNPEVATKPLVASTTVKPEVVSSTTTKPEVVSSITTKPEVVSSITAKPEVVSSTTTKPEAVSSITTKPEAVISTTITPEKMSTITKQDDISPTSTKPEITSSTTIINTPTIPEIAYSTTTTKLDAASTVTTNKPEIDGSTATKKPDSLSTTDETAVHVIKPEVTTATEPEERVKTTTTATEAETRTTSLVSSAPSPGTISSSSNFATQQQQTNISATTSNQHVNISAVSTTSATLGSNINDNNTTGNGSGASVLTDTIKVDGDIETIKTNSNATDAITTSLHLITSATATTTTSSSPSSRRRIVVDIENPPTRDKTTTTTESPPKLIEDDVLVMEDLPISTVDVQTISVSETGSGSLDKDGGVEEDNTGESDTRNQHRTLAPSIDNKIYVDNDDNDRTDRNSIVISESNDVPHALWFVLVLDGNCSLISRGRQGQGERGFKNQVLESASQWLTQGETPDYHDDVTVTEFHCTSPDRIRANLTVFRRPGVGGPGLATNVSARLAGLEQSREPFMKYHGQDFYVYQIVTADGYLNKEPDLPPLVDIKHSNVDLVISIATGSTCAFLVLLAIALLAYKYWGGGTTQKPFDFGAVSGQPAADQLTNMRLEDYTLTRIPRPRLGHVQDYYYRGLHAKRNYAPLTDDPRHHDKVFLSGRHPITGDGGGMVRASDTSVVPLEDDSVAALASAGFRDGIIVRPMDIRQSGGQQQHYRQLLGGSLGRLYRGARRSAGRTASSKLATVVDAEGFRVRSTENLHSALEAGRTVDRRAARLPGEEAERCVVDRGVDNPNFQ